MKSSIRMFVTKIDVDLENPEISMIDIRDIAHNLAGINRFVGGTVRPYSVAHHSLMVSYRVEPCYALEGLLHDASEAYLGDVSGPLKRLLPDYQRLEAKWMGVIAERFGLLRWESANVKEIDALALQVEMDMLLDCKKLDRFAAPGPGVAQRMAWYLREETHGKAEDGKRLFLARFHELLAERHLAQLDRQRA